MVLLCHLVVSAQQEKTAALTSLLAGAYHFQLGLALSQTSAKEKAEEELEKSVPPDDSHAPALLELANIYYETSRYQETLPLLEKAVQLTPDFESPYYLLSRTYAQVGTQRRLAGNSEEVQGGPRNNSTNETAEGKRFQKKDQP